MSSAFRAAVCAMVFAVAGASPALAMPLGQVSVSGADVAQVHQRIEQAAETLCRIDYVPRIHSLRELRRCVAETTADAVARSGRPDLIAFHASRSGGEATTVAALR